MINLISKSPQKAIEQIGVDAYYAHCGMLVQPNTGYSADLLLQAKRFAIDNGCFMRYEPKKILNYLCKLQGVTGCIFAVLPDVVTNHRETYLLSMQWLDTYHRLGYPPAFVIQNGVTLRDVPYSEIACVFIGGDDKFKTSPIVLEICQEAKLRGLWIHAGRVGGLRRLRNSQDILQVDSFDSSGFSIHPPKIKEFLPHMTAKRRTLWELMDK